MTIQEEIEKFIEILSAGFIGAGIGVAITFAEKVTFVGLFVIISWIMFIGGIIFIISRSFRIKKYIELKLTKKYSLIKKNKTFLIRKFYNNKNWYEISLIILTFIATIAALITTLFSFWTVGIAKDTLIIAQNSFQLEIDPTPLLDSKLYYALNIMPENPQINGTIPTRYPQIEFNLSIANRGTTDTVVILTANCTGNFEVDHSYGNTKFAQYCGNGTLLWIDRQILDIGNKLEKTFYIKTNHDLINGERIKGKIIFYIFDQTKRVFLTKELRVNLFATNESVSGTSVISYS